MSVSRTEPELAAEQIDTETDTENQVIERPEPSLDITFDVLRNRRRRLVLKAIEERGGSTTLGELAEHIGGIENNKSPKALNAQERKRVYVGLYQCHLPKMDDAGAIRFDKDRGTVERGPLAEQFHEYLEREVEIEGNWPRYYGAAVACSFVVYLGVFFVGGPTSVVTIASLALVGGLSVYHWLGS
jgi:hypothetical protein